MIAVRIPGWLERTCKILAASQEAVLEAGLDICYKPHFHPHIHRTLHESISITGGGARVKNRGRKGGVVVHCNAGLAKSKKRSEERASVGQCVFFLLQQLATATCSVSVSADNNKPNKPNKDMHHHPTQEMDFDAKTKSLH